MDQNSTGMKKLQKWGLAVAAAAGLILLNVLFFSKLSAQDIQAFLLRFGSAAALMYILLFAVLPVFFFPVAILAFAGGFLFGLVRGSLYTLVGASVNCALMFLISRYAARDEAQSLLKRRLPEKWLRILFSSAQKRLFFTVILLRLIPAVPYNLINYAAGLTGMTFPTYMLASVIGILPGTVAFINIGESSQNVYSPRFWIALGLLSALLAVTAGLGKKLFPSDADGSVLGQEKRS